MTYADFLDELEERLCRNLFEGEQIHRVQVLKNNGVKLDGFSYQIDGRREQPTVYVNHYYQEQISEEELEGTALQILKIQRESRMFPGKELERVLDYESMKEAVCYRLISREKNQELLDLVPYIPWLDLAIVFYLQIPERIIENATALIYNSHMEQWGITLGELYRTASVNMEKMPVFLEPMEDFLERMGLSASGSGMYILGSRSREFGAAAMVAPQTLKLCRERLGEDYYVLPSSIHELILLPDSMAATREEMDRMVCEVNESCVSREDFLSSHVYHYSARSGQLEF